MKTLKWIAFISAGMGFLFIFIGIIHVLITLFDAMFGIFPKFDGRLFGDTEVINFFIASTNFFIITIAIYVIQFKNQLIKD